MFNKKVFMISMLLIAASSFMSCKSGGSSSISSSFNDDSSSSSSSSPIGSSSSSSSSESSLPPSSSEPSSSIEEKPSEGLTYTLSEDETHYIVSDYNHHVSDEHVVIPSVHNDLPVSEIATEGFAERWWITSVVIPESITKIGDGAFSMTGLKKVYYNATHCADLNARNWVFYPDYTYQSIDLYIGANVLHIPNRLFFPLSTKPNVIPVVNSITFAENSVCQSIGDYAFYQLSNVRSINLPKSLVSIGQYAFFGCGLTNLSMPKSLTTIGKKAFSVCLELTSVEFGSGLSEMGSGAFEYCTKLSSVNLSSTLLEFLSDEAFKNCMNISSFIAGEVLKEIGISSFEGCTSLTSLVLGKNITTLGNKAFMGCSGLIDITLSENVKNIGNYAFADCPNVANLYFNAMICEDLPSGNNVFTNLGQNTLGTNVVFGTLTSVIPARLFFATSDVTALPKIQKITFSGTSCSAIHDYAFHGLTISEVLYPGTPSQWDQIQIGLYNEALSNIQYAVAR